MLQLFSHIDLILLGLLLAVVLYQCYFYFRYMMAAARKLRRAQQAESQTIAESEWPKVSVIVCARNEEQNLKDYLHTLVHQDYPCYEVIVVNDASEDKTDILLEQYAQQVNNLYVTFVPQNARVISSKKLALTIGAKAAHYECLLLTDADCRPESNQWIKEMMKGFVNGGENTEIVLGYGAYFQKKGILNQLICFDTLFIGLQYMGMAIAGHPYMGVGRNLAYKRSTFFAHDGFRGMLNERAGDDDLFVNKVANKHNTQVVCSPESITWSIPKLTWKEWLHQKRRHLSVSNHYKKADQIRLCIEPFTRGMLYALLIATTLLGSSLAILIAFGLWWLRLLMQFCVINISSYRLGGKAYGIEIILYELFLPLLTLFIMNTKWMYKKRLYW